MISSDSYSDCNSPNFNKNSNKETLKAEFNFIRTYRQILNYLIEEDIATSNKFLIKVKIVFKIALYRSC